VLPPREALLAGDATCWWWAADRPASAPRIGAADAGARVVLAERYGFLGGNATAALVMPLMSFHTATRPQGNARRDRAAADRPRAGRPDRRRRAQALLERLVSVGGAIAPSLADRLRVPFDPEWFKQVALELLDERACASSSHSLRPAGVPARHRRRGVRDQVRPRWCAPRCHSTAPATADVAVQAGAPYEVGRADGWCSP
jgi:hypothetical protein